MADRPDTPPTPPTTIRRSLADPLPPRLRALEDEPGDERAGHPAGTLLEAPDLAALAKLTVAPRPNEVSKKPVDVDKGGTKSKCAVCGGWHAPSSHLDYMGHAAVTARLLDADPCWWWEPVAVDDLGRPVLDGPASGSPTGLWIRLHVAGMSRLGYGSCPPGKADAVKELIGDAIRNAAMRFGVGLDLWHKGGDLFDHDPNATRTTNGSSSPPPPPADDPGAGPPLASPADVARIRAAVDALEGPGRDWLYARWQEEVRAGTLRPLSRLAATDLPAVAALLTAARPHVPDDDAPPPTEASAEEAADAGVLPDPVKADDVGVANTPCPGCGDEILSGADVIAVGDRTLHAACARDLAIARRQTEEAPA